MGTGLFSPWISAVRHELDHSPPPSAGVCRHSLNGVVIKQMGNVTALVFYMNMKSTFQNFGNLYWDCHILSFPVTSVEILYLGFDLLQM